MIQRVWQIMNIYDFNWQIHINIKDTHHLHNSTFSFADKNLCINIIILIKSALITVNSESWMNINLIISIEKNLPPQMVSLICQGLPCCCWAKQIRWCNLQTLKVTIQVVMVMQTSNSENNNMDTVMQSANSENNKIHIVMQSSNSENNKINGYSYAIFRHWT